MITVSQTTLFRKLFVHRADAHMRKNDCGWKPVRDAGCDRPFGEGQARTHLEGFCHLGVFPLKFDTCIFVAADFDENENAFEQSWKLHENFKEDKIYSLVERSSSGNGYHVWIFFDAPVKGQEARTLMFNALEKYGIPFKGPLKKGSNTKRSLDRLFPAQDKTNTYGNIIGLPLNGEAVIQGNCVFIDADQQPYADQWAKLEEAYANRISADHPKLKETRTTVAPPIDNDRPECVTEGGRWLELGQLEGQQNRVLGCEAIKQSISDPNNFREPAWQAVLSNIAIFGNEGEELAYKVSRGYSTYDEDETQRKYYRKLDELQKGGYPFSCAGLDKNGWTCPKLKECRFNFIALYDAPESYNYYNPEVPLTAEDRKQLYSWEQSGGYNAYLQLFPNRSNFGVRNESGIRGIKRKEYWILKHLLGDTPLYVKFPNWDNQVKSIWFEWSTEEDANLFEQQTIHMEIPFERTDLAFWLLQDAQAFNGDTAKKLIKKVALTAGIQLSAYWDDPLIFMDPYRVAPYFGKWKEYCI
ncbi:hypothetical protein ACDZ28_09090 [Paenibacillus sp. RS8]|uniref:TOTE conflict system primase domain-containing protein n=1 Tax=Paenibacillus odorifer TaxID=189426 RepID=A0A1R0Y9H9_9BACL|nr:hypothetical protein [Paenibacillus odorifer]OMD44023.1 hypothetical protein BSK52_00280 [Paenibacillus odorifer]